MKIEKDRAKKLISFAAQDIVNECYCTYKKDIYDGAREKQKALPKWLSWIYRAPQRHVSRAKAEKQFWGITGPGQRIQKEADKVKEAQSHLKHNLDAAKESDLVEITEDRLLLLEAGYHASGWDRKSEKETQTNQLKKPTNFQSPPGKKPGDNKSK